MKLKRNNHGTIIIIQDRDDKSVLDVIVSKKPLSEDQIEGLVTIACMDNNTSPDDVHVETSKIYYDVTNHRQATKVTYEIPVQVPPNQKPVPVKSRKRK